MAADIPLFADADGTALLWQDRMLIQVRRGTLTVPKLLLIIERLNAVVDTVAGHHGALMLLEADAPLLSDDVRAIQRKSMSGLIRRKDVSSAVVVMGDSIAANMQRALVRMYAIGAPAFRVFADPEAAIAWVTDELERHGVRIDAAGLSAALADARRGPD